MPVLRVMALHERVRVFPLQAMGLEREIAAHPSGFLIVVTQAAAVAITMMVPLPLLFSARDSCARTQPLN